MSARTPARHLGRVAAYLIAVLASLATRAVAATDQDLGCQRPLERGGYRYAIGGTGMAVLEVAIRQLHRCLERPEAVSIAACLADPVHGAAIDQAVGAWRQAAEASCAGVDPFADLGYRPLCSGQEPAYVSFD